MAPEKLADLFSPASIGPLKIKNRIGRSATFELKCEGGRIGSKYLEFYKALAEGGVGLIMTGYGTPCGASVNDGVLNLSDDSCIDGLTQLADTVHENGNDCRIIVQLNHMGRQFRAKNPNLKAPSAVLEPVFGNIPKAMTIEEIEDCIEQFAQGILRCQKAGIDGVQLHAAHGWLLSTFLSPATNRRQDKYGRTTINRTRMMREIIARARQLVGEDYPIMAKINGKDFVEGGLELPEACLIAAILADAGFDALEISSCMWETTTVSEDILGWHAEMIPESRTHIKEESQEGYHVDFAAKIKEAVPGIPIMVVGGFRSPELMNQVIRCGQADLITMSRPFICEPDLPARWEAGVIRKSDCISCNACLDTLHDRNLHCVMKERT